MLGTVWIQKIPFHRIFWQLYLTDLIRKKVDKGHSCDMLDPFHGILLYELKALGFSEMAIKWVKSYLTGRTQRVDINRTLSSSRDITCGVPEGGILGPLLFCCSILMI